MQQEQQHDGVDCTMHVEEDCPERCASGGWQISQLERGTRLSLWVSGKTHNDFALHRTEAAEEGEQADAIALPTRHKEGASDAPSQGGWPRQMMLGLWQQVQDTLLPAGYPDSVGPRYMNYTLWLAATNCANAANGVLASTFLLFALNQTADPVEGAMSWVAKESLGMLAALIVGKFFAHKFDTRSKTWSYLSNAVFCLAIVLEISTYPAPGSAVVALMCLAAVSRSVAMLTSGATRSVFNLSLARNNNIGDVTAKNMGQYVLASLAGMGIGAGICTSIRQLWEAALVCYVLLAVVSMYTAYRTMTCLPLYTLNGNRLQLLVGDYLGRRTRPRRGSRRPSASAGSSAGPHHFEDAAAAAATATAGRMYRGSVPPREPGEPCPRAPGSWTEGLGSSRQQGRAGQHQLHSRMAEQLPDIASLHQRHQGIKSAATGGRGEHELPTPVQLADRDPVLPWFSSSRHRPRILVGTRLEKLFDGKPQLLVLLISSFRGCKYIVLPQPKATHVLLHVDAGPQDIVQAFLQADILHRHQQAQPLPSDRAALRILLHDSLLAARSLVGPFCGALADRGWDVELVGVESRRRRAVW